MITPAQAAATNTEVHAKAYARQEERIDKVLAAYNGESVREIMVDMTGTAAPVVDMVIREYGKHWAIAVQYGSPREPGPVLTFSAHGMEDNRQ